MHAKTLEKLNDTYELKDHCFERKIRGTKNVI